MKLFQLPNRSILKVHGPDARQFLHNVTTNNVLKVTPEHSIYNLVLNPKGRYMFDFFLTQREDYFLLDCNSADTNDLKSFLNLHKLQLKVKVKQYTDEEYTIAADLSLTGVPGETKSDPNGSILIYDPRHSEMGMRAIILGKTTDSIQCLREASANHHHTEYEIRRIRHTIPDCEKDMQRGESFPLYFRLDTLNAIDKNKGCYIGQEVVARMYRNGPPKTLYTIMSDSTTPLPPLGTKVTTAKGEEAGHLLSSTRNLGLCILRTEKIKEERDLRVNDMKVKLYKRQTL